MRAPSSFLLLLLLSLSSVQALSFVRDHTRPPREAPLPPAKRQLSAGGSSGNSPAHVARNNAHHHGRMVRRRAAAAARAPVQVEERDLIKSLLNPGAANAAPSPGTGTSTGTSTQSQTSQTSTSTTSTSSANSLTNTQTSTSTSSGTTSSGTSTSTSGTSTSTTSSSTTSTSTTSSSTTPTAAYVPPTLNNNQQQSTEYQYITSGASRPSISPTNTANSNNSGSSTSSTSIAKNTLIAIIVIASVVGVSAAVFTIVRKWKFGPSSKFEERMQPIDFSPGGGPEDVEEKAHRRGGSGGSWEAGSSEKNEAGYGAGSAGPSVYPDATPAAADGYAAYPQAHDYTSGAYPAHDFTAGPTGAAGYGYAQDQYGYADMSRGGADPNAQQQYYADPAQAHAGADLARGPSANYGQYAAYAAADPSQLQHTGADLARGPSANYGQYPAYAADPSQLQHTGAELARGPSANYGQYAQHAQAGYAEDAYGGYANNGGYPAVAHQQAGQQGQQQAGQGYHPTF